VLRAQRGNIAAAVVRVILEFRRDLFDVVAFFPN
jgi:hypothetical protein